jgi:hypothetical protein
MILSESVDLSALDGMFGTGAEDVLIAEAAQPTNILLDNDASKALDTPEPEKKVVADTKTPVAEVETIDDKKLANVLDDASNQLVDTSVVETPEAAEKAGRPKTDKNAMVSYLAQKIEANEFGIPDDAPFDAKKQTVEQYLATLPEKELHGILDSNWKAKEDELRAQTPKEFFDSLPDELQYAAAYVAEGGQDLKGLFRALSHVEEVKALDPAKEEDQVLIARNYLQATGFGTEDQIAEQIEDWKDANKIAKKATEFKPALDNMQKQQVEAHIRVAEEQKQQQAKLAQFYSNNVFQTLEKNELAGVKLDKKFARELGNNMVSTVPGPWSGKPVNYLGYGLEKAQYVEPDYEAVMIASWILNDKKAALTAIRSQGESAAAEKITKLVKLNQGLGTSEQPAQPEKVVKRIPNQSNVLRKVN